jgi:hypothetical protein
MQKQRSEGKGSQAAMKAWASRRLKAGIPQQMVLGGIEAGGLASSTRAEVGKQFIMRSHCGNEILTIPHQLPGPGMQQPAGNLPEQYLESEWDKKGGRWCF